MLNNVKMTNDLYCVVNVNNDNTLSFVDNINPLLKNEIETNVDKECAENTAYNVEVLTQQDIAPNYGINWLTVDRVFSFNEVDCLSVKYYVMNRLKEYITQEN